MRELELQYPCPACLGVIMAKLRMGDAPAPLVIDHCRRCGGVWLQAGELLLLRELTADRLWQYIARAAPPARYVCHHCHTPLARDADRCDACSAANALDCPQCERPMRTDVQQGVRLDACHECRGVWFDHHELDAVWRLELQSAIERRRAGGATDSAAVHSLVDVLIWMPDLPAAAAFGLAEAGAAAVEGLAAVGGEALHAGLYAPEAAAAAAEVAGEAAAGVFSTIVEIIGGIFS